MSDEEKKLLLDAWKHVVTVQMHFNDLELRIRSFAFSFTAAFLALGGYALKDAGSVIVFGTDVTIASVIVFFATLPLLAFYFMERWWYHPLLIGSVLEGAALEKKLQDADVGISLGENISRESGFSNWLVGTRMSFSQAQIDDNDLLKSRSRVAHGDSFYVKKWGLLYRRSFRSAHKMNVFYLLLVASLLIVAVALSLPGVARPRDPSSSLATATRVSMDVRWADPQRQLSIVATRIPLGWADQIGMPCRAAGAEAPRRPLEPAPGLRDTSSRAPIRAQYLIQLFSPDSINRRIASEREGFGSGWRSIQASSFACSSG